MSMPYSPENTGTVSVRSVSDDGVREDDVAYEIHGSPGLPLIIALGGISAGRHIAASATDERPGWWEPIVGPGRALDTTRLRVLSIDWLGGAGDSVTARDRISTADQARAIAGVLDHLGVRRAHAVVGASYGGMVALAFSARFGDRVDQAIVIGAAHASHPMATALRALQRRIVRLGLETDRVDQTLAIARGLAMTTYRTAEEFAGRFAQNPISTPPCGGSAGVVRSEERVRFPVEDYLDDRGARFAAAFPPEAFLRLSESIDLHDVDPATIRVPTTLIAFEPDAITPSWQVRALAERLGRCTRLIEIRSRYGHDAFLKEVDAMTAVIQESLAGTAGTTFTAAAGGVR